MTTLANRPARLSGNELMNNYALELPFGIDLRTGIQGLSYTRTESFLEPVEKPHEYFQDYRVITFPASEAFGIRADSEPIDDIETALDMFEQVRDELIGKYGLPFGEDESEPLDWNFYIDTGIPPMKNWLFDFKPDGQPHFSGIMFRMIRHEVSGWGLAINYFFQTQKAETSL